MSRQFNAEATLKIKQIVNEGIATLQEIETLNEGLNDTIKHIAEELEIKPSILKKAIKIAYKQSLQIINEENAKLNEILEVAGKA
jgi:DNA-binding MarR family transcriptional regulator